MAWVKLRCADVPLLAALEALSDLALELFVCLDAQRRTLTFQGNDDGTSTNVFLVPLDVYAHSSTSACVCVNTEQLVRALQTHFHGADSVILRLKPQEQHVHVVFQTRKCHPPLDVPCRTESWTGPAQTHGPMTQILMSFAEVMRVCHLLSLLENKVMNIQVTENVAKLIVDSMRVDCQLEIRNPLERTRDLQHLVTLHPSHGPNFNTCVSTERLSTVASLANKATHHRFSQCIAALLLMDKSAFLEINLPGRVRFVFSIH